MSVSVNVHTLSGEIFSISITEAFISFYRIINLRNEVYHILRKIDPSLNNDKSLVFSKIGEDEELDDYDLVYGGDNFRVFVRELIQENRVRLSLSHNNVICLRKDGFLIGYYGCNLEDRIDDLVDMEPYVNLPVGNIILEVDLSDEAYDIMRNDLEDLAEEDLEDRDRIFNIFMERFINLNNVVETLFL
jgi:hypothetical protein